MGSLTEIPALVASSAAPMNPLTAIVLIPVIGAAVVSLIPANRKDAHRIVALMFSAISGALSVYLLTQFRVGDGGYQFIVDAEWITTLGSRWHLGVDGISLFLVVLTGLLFPLAIVAVKPGHDDKAYYAWLLLLMTGSMGVFLALDLLVFFLFFELVLVPMYFLIGLWGHGNAKYAATKFFLYTMFGSSLMLVGVVATAILHARATGDAMTFDMKTISDAQAIGSGSARWIFASFALAFAVKVPLFPLHTWLPDAHTEAPTAGSVILAGVMLKLGTYGFLRLCVGMFPNQAYEYRYVLLTLATIGIVYGAICATMQTDLKRLVAYSSVAHLGFIILGIFAFNVQGIEGGVVQMVNHGIATPALFLLVGMIYERRHTREIGELGGLQSSAPIMAGTFVVVMFASIGLPGLNGFVGEFLALLGAFEGARWWAVVSATGVILAALYLLWAYQRTFQGPATGDNATMPDLKIGEALVMVPFVVLIVVLGLYPKPMLDRIEPSVDVLLEHVAAHVEDFSRSEFDGAPVAASDGADANQDDEAGGH